MKLMLLTKVLPAVALVIGAQSISACGDINGDGNQAKGRAKQYNMGIAAPVTDASIVQGDGNITKFKPFKIKTTHTTTTNVTANTKVKLF
jgi:hypothetical protein